jgi:hypothetical protein
MSHSTQPTDLYIVLKGTGYRIANTEKKASITISQTTKAINALNSIWRHKNITKNIKLYIYQTIIQRIFMYDAEVW